MIIVKLLAIGQQHTYPSWEAFSRSKDSKFCLMCPDAVKMFMQITEVI